MQKIKSFFFGAAIAAFTLGVMGPATAQAKDVAAEVNGDKILVEDVRAIYDSNPHFKQRPFDELYDVILNVLVNSRLVKKAAIKAGMDKKPEVAEELERAKEQILRAYYFKTQAEKAMTDEALKKLYLEMVAEQPKGTERRVRHILVKEKELAEDIIEKIQDGEEFAVLAAKHSTDGTKDDGGDLGYISREQVVKPFGDSAFTLDIGKMSKKPVKSQFGWHIIKVEDERELEVPSFKDMKPALEKAFADRMIGEEIERLTNDAQIKMYKLDGELMDRED